MSQVTIELEELKRLLKLDDDQKVTPTTEDVVKSIDDDKRLFTALVLRPNVVDAHGDIYDENTVEKACFGFNEYCGNANLQHLVDTTSIVFVESYIEKSNYILGETEVFKGDWIATARIDNDEVWEMCKSGEFTGFSIAAACTVEALDG